jgi:hypothetical protein
LCILKIYGILDFREQDLFLAECVCQLEGQPLVLARRRQAVKNNVNVKKKKKNVKKGIPSEIAMT